MGLRLGFFTAIFSAMFCRASLMTYSWSVTTYCPILGAVARATRPDTPAPSSRTVEFLPRTLVENKGLEGEAIHDANSGVTFQSTAPVVPVGSEEARSVGDCAIVTSLLLRAMLSEEALGSKYPRFDDGIGLVKREKDSRIETVRLQDSAEGNTACDLRLRPISHRPAAEEILEVPLGYYGK